MAQAPEQVSALDHGLNFMRPEWNQERADFTVGGSRGLLDMVAQAALPIGAPLVMSPVNQALDDLEWRWNIGSGSGFHQAGAFIIPTILSGGGGGGGGVTAAVETRAPRVVADIVVPKGVNPEPLILYRGMTSSADGYPLIGATAKTLGARPKVSLPREQGDIVIDADGMVWPNTGGMSSNTDIASIPSFRLPEALGGGGKNIELFRISDTEIPTGLIFHFETTTHGFMEPARPMSYQEMQELLHSTRYAWQKVQPQE